MSNLNILGLDIGGANTKAALIQCNELKIQKSFSYIEYFPFWEQNLNQIPNLFKRIIEKLLYKNQIKLKDLNYISITITAELSDAFQTKREGIDIILNSLDKVFNRDKMFFINTNCEFIKFEKVKNDYLSIAAANWVSTSLFLGKFIPKCILIDAGSTTIDIIPILDSRPRTVGKTDIERLINHELIYTGALRATIPSITHFVQYKGEKVRISFEKFALISDIHRILNNISEKEYINDTADNRGKSIDHCYARLARIICMDIETITKDDLDKIANNIYQKQLEIIESEISQFLESLYSRLPEFHNNLLFIITGLAADFLIQKALIRLGFNNIQYYETVTNITDNINSSALAVAGALFYKLQNDIENGN
ncbi:MAG: hydantoinase/oxoprolinase family protein [Candidatus Hermodarchaeota archaeon]